MKYQVTLQNGEPFTCDRFLSQVNSDKQSILYFYDNGHAHERLEPAKNVVSITPIDDAAALEAPAAPLNGPVAALSEAQNESTETESATELAEA